MDIETLFGIRPQALARLLDIPPSRLVPSELARGGLYARVLGLASSILRGDQVVEADHDREVWARAAMLVERLDEGDYSVIELIRRLPTWGIEVEERRVCELCQRARTAHVEGGWTAVRREVRDGA